MIGCDKKGTNPLWSSFPNPTTLAWLLKKKKKLDKFQLSKRLQNLNSTSQSCQGLEDYRKTDPDWRRIKAIWWLMEHGSLDWTLEQEKKKNTGKTSEI